jgi:hypothetical protein
MNEEEVFPVANVAPVAPVARNKFWMHVMDHGRESRDGGEGSDGRMKKNFFPLLTSLPSRETSFGCMSWIMVVSLVTEAKEATEE